MRWFLREETHENAEAVLNWLIEKPELFAVPDLFAYEILAVLHRTHPDPQRVYTVGVIPILQAGMLRYPMTENIAVRAGEYCRLGLTAYDASYAAVAEELKGLWITFDTEAHRKIANPAISHDLNTSLPEKP